MLTIRFARVGKVNKAQYKIVLQEKTFAPGGRHVEILGSYNPHSKVAVLKEEKIKSWIAKGAQLSDTVHNLFVSRGVITEKKKVIKMPTRNATPANNVSHNDTNRQNVAGGSEKKVEEVSAEGVDTDNKEVSAGKIEEKVETPVVKKKEEAKETPKDEAKKE